MTVDSVHEMICQVFSLPPGFDFRPGIRPAFIPGWDSHGWMRIIMELEESFGREIPLDLFDRVVTVEDFCNVVIQFSSQKATA